ncbi:Protein ENL [Aphelenchoides bicaudatus]|nr:Protein ENL [Aphelenchoides bicaudatus]
MPPESSTLPAVLCALTIGHDVEKLDRPTRDGRTHKWKVFVRSPADYPDYTDRSFIKKVVFQLHTTFENPKRSIRQPPFELEETAYGCFNLPITIQFRNVEKTYSVNHDITLSMKQKVTQIQNDQFIEITNPPSKEFINLAIKYGGKLKQQPLPEKAETSSSKSVLRLNENEEKHRRVDASSDQASTEKHHKKHKKRDKSKEHKKKRKHSDSESTKSKLKSPESSIANLTSRATSNANDLFDAPKRSKADDERKSSVNTLLKISSSKRPKFFVSSKIASETSNVKEEPPKPLSNESSSDTVTNQSKIEEKPSMEKISQMSEKLKQQVNEMTKVLAAPISPIGKLQNIKAEEGSNTPQHVLPVERPTSGVVKDEAYMKNLQKIRSLLSQPIKRKNYNLSFLHTLDNVSDKFISNYERAIPLVSFEPGFTQLSFKKEDNKKAFDRHVASGDEPQLLRLAQKRLAKSSMPASPSEQQQRCLAGQPF